MLTSVTDTAPPPTRPNARAGAIVAIAALLGLAGVLSASYAVRRADRVMAGVARSVARPGTVLIASGQTFGWSAATIVVLLWLGRRFPLAVSPMAWLRRIACRLNLAICLILHRITSISHRNGGLYGP
ncbi:MAG: hypothetical protein ACE5F9_01475 [Phycisphaerae bacterium]